MLYSYKVLLKWITLAYTLVILLVSVLPTNSKSSSFPLNNNHILHIRLDHLVHAILFVPWILLIWFVTHFNFRTKPLNAMAYMALCLLFAAAMELIQYFLPYRTFTLYDLLANEAGVLSGFALCVVIQRLFKQLKEHHHV